MGQRDIDDRRVENLHEGRHSDDDGDEPGIGAWLPAAAIFFVFVVDGGTRPSLRRTDDRVRSMRVMRLVSLFMRGRVFMCGRSFERMGAGILVRAIRRGIRIASEFPRFAHFTLTRGSTERPSGIARLGSSPLSMTILTGTR